MGRPVGSRNRKKKGVNARFNSSIYRLNISYLLGYGTFQPLGKDVKRARNISSGLDTLKVRVLDQILHRESSRGLRYHSVAWQTHQSTGQPHLDILLVYDSPVRKYASSFNYLFPLCPQRESQTTPGVFITGYSKTRLNKAILEYGVKEDPQPLSNLPQDLRSFLDLKKLQKDPYAYLDDQMSKDPLHFNLQQYVRENGLAKHIKGWSGIKTKLKDMQVAAANLLLKQRPGFKLITRQLIQQILSPSQLTLYDSWSGYQCIVDYLNQVPTYGYKRPLKTMNLLITGPASIGKTSLFESDLNKTRNCVQDYVSVYPMGARTWWPNYRSEVYKMIFWNQAKLTSYSYDTILKVLEGSKVDLPQKGTSTLKYDNPLVVMTSNMTLQQMIVQKFGYDKFYVQMARDNLSVRVENVVVPPGYDLFLLQKLLVDNTNT